ncbi:MAG: hypothetical protein PHN69_05250 [Candidatus Pacebacteria bacterium]|nr:hypothetical protein [Candidatus Paceibacterota bacterium]
MIALNKRLNVSEQQKIEITDMLFSFMKKIEREQSVKKLSSQTIVNWWLEYTNKPKWIKEKIDNDFVFVVGIHEFIEAYKNKLPDIFSCS